MNTIPEATGEFETPTALQQERNSNRNVTTRPQVRSALYQFDHAHEIDEDEPIEGLRSHAAHDHEDDNMSIKSAHSSSSSSQESSWMQNTDLLRGSHAKSHQAYRLLSGGLGVTTDIKQSSISSMFSALPIVKNLTNLWRTHNGKSECPNIAAVIAELEKERPLIFNAILDVTSSTGHLAREKILTASDMLHDGSKTHNVIVQAAMCYVWVISGCSTRSPN
jgi:hypothetical protein